MNADEQGNLLKLKGKKHSQNTKSQTKNAAADDIAAYKLLIGAYYPFVGAYDADKIQCPGT